jgi:hypothetical protein
MRYAINYRRHNVSMPSVHFSLNLDDPRLPAVLTALGMPPSTGAPGPAQKGSYADPRGLAVIDDTGAAIIADPRNASAAYLAALQLIASKPDVTEAELLGVAGASTLAGHKAATSKRVKRVLAGRSAALYRTEQGKVVVADATRQSLARHFGI